MKLSKQISLFALFLLLLSVNIQAEEQVNIENRVILVIGTGRIYSENVAKARNLAISNSLVSAIENVAKDFLPLESLVQNFQVINETLYNNTEEFIEEYKVLTEALTGNIYRVMVQATVSIDKVQQQLSTAGIMIGKKPMPRVLFLIAEQNTEDNLPQYWWGKGMSAFKGVTENSMADIMIKKGFLIIDYENLAKNLENETLDTESELDNQVTDETLRPESELDNQKAVELGLLVNADVVIVGKAIASKAPNIMGKNIKSFNGTLTVHAFRTDTGEKIASSLQTSVSANVDEIKGGRAALSDAGTIAGKDLSLQILEEWKKEIKKPVNIEIVVVGTADFSNYIQFRKTLDDMPGVDRVQPKEMKIDKSIISVDFRGNTKELADALMLNAFDSFGINIYEVSENSLSIEIISSE